VADLQRAVEGATRLLATHDVRQPPVDVQRIAEAEGLRVEFQELEDRISGILVQKDQSAMIGINALHHPNRQRFSLAHELAHYWLHPHSPTVWVDDMMVHFRGEDLHAPASQYEVEANTFAASLLMPAPFLQQDLQGSAIDAMDEAAVRRLALRYQVSQQALTIRLMELGLLKGVAGTGAR
jgi:Zn-dependent peptidase ImmA (M78 family)